MKPTDSRPQQSGQGQHFIATNQALYAVMDEAAQPQLLFTHDGFILHANRAFCTLAGCIPAEAQGQHLETWQQGRWQQVLAGWQQVRREQEPASPYRVQLGESSFILSCRHLPGGAAPYTLLSLSADTLDPSTQATPGDAGVLASALFEASPDCLKILDLDGCLQAMNTCGRALMEVDDFETLRGAYWPSLWGASQQLVEDALARARKGGMSRFAASCPTVKGSPRHWEVLVAPAFGAGGEVLRLIASSRDITAAEATRTALHRSQELAKTLFDQSPDCLKLMDTEGRLIALNESGKRIMAANGVHTDINWLDLWPTAYRQQVLSALQTAAGGGTGAFTAPCTLPSGQTFWWEVLLTPVRNEKGRVYQVMAACRDITGRKELEQQLAHNALQKELALQAASMGTWSFDFGSEDMGMDERARELFGLEAAQKLSHADLFALVHPEDRPHLEATIADDIRKRNSISHVEYRLNPERGSSRWVHACRQMFFDETGNPQHCVGLLQDITQQKETELRLRKINQTLQLGIQVGKLAIAEVDYTTDQVMLSAEAAQLYGFAPATRQVSREQLHACFHPADKNRILQHIHQYLDPAGPGFMHLEHRIIQAGGVRWLNVRKQVFFDDGGTQAKPLYAIIAAQDITAQKEAADRIQESETRFKAIFNGAPVAIWEEDFSKGMALLENLSKKGVRNFGHYCAQHPELIPTFLGLLEVRDVNEAAVQLFEAGSKTDLIERLPHTFLPESLEVFAQELVALATGKGAYKGVARMQTLRGNPIWVLLSVRFPQDSNHSSVLVTMTDITVQKKLEAEVGAHAGRIQQILDGLPQKAWIGSPEGDMEYFSQQWYAYTGLDKSSSLGSHWQEAIHPQDLPQLIRAFVQAKANKEDWELQTRVRNKSGRYRWHLARAIALKTEAGDLSSWVGISTDIHEQRTAADLLEQAVAERTQALEQSNRALQNTNKELEEFLYVASHDLQEPVRKIRTFANLVLERGQDRLSDQCTHYLHRIEAAAQQMNSLIRSILDFSSLRTNLPVETCDLNTMMASLVQELGWFIQQEDAELSIQQLPQVVGVPQEVKQLFYNLIANALKFRRRETPPVVTVTSQPLPPSEREAYALPAQPYAHITVADNGIGFEPQYAEKIFTMFQRLHNRSQYDGAGIGLALCKKIATKAGGHIWAEAVAGAGARFHVLLPAASHQD